MFKNHFKIAWRGLWKNKFYTTINILGLSIGLTTSILLLLWIQDEKSFDKFNKDYDRVYNLSAHFDISGKEQVWGGVPGTLYKSARSMMQIQTITRVNDDWITLHQVNDKKLIPGLHVAYVDSTFFSIANPVKSLRTE
jgi:hypothetical protein